MNQQPYEVSIKPIADKLKMNHLIVKKMKFFQVLFPVLLIPFFILGFSPVEAETIKQTMEGSLELEIDHPKSVLNGRVFSISVLLNNNGWEDKQEISLIITNPDESIVAIDSNEIKVDRLSTGGSYGRTLDFQVISDANEGTHFLNILYSQVLVSNNEEPLEPTSSNIAIPIIVKGLPLVSIHTVTPEAIFANAEFPFEVEVISEDIDINDVSIQVIAPQNIEFLGEEVHRFSSIQSNVPISITTQFKTPLENISTEQKIPFEVIVSYTDDVGNEITDSKTIPLVLRPRNMMEITTDGGIWIGDFFIAPYVSIGTLVGIPAGTLFSIAIKRSLEKKKKRKKK